MTGIRLSFSCVVCLAVLQSGPPRLSAQNPDTTRARPPDSVQVRTALRFLFRPTAADSTAAPRALPVPRAALRPPTPVAGIAVVLQRPSALSGLFTGVVAGAACPQGSPTLQMRDPCWQVQEWDLSGAWRLFGSFLGQALTSDRWRELRTLRDNRPVP